MKIDKEKVKKNSIDALGVALGLGLGYFALGLVKGKLPSQWLEPLVPFIPGVAGTILIDNDFANSMAKGASAAGIVSGIEKGVSAVISKIPAAAPLAKVTPKSGNLAGVGEYNRPSVLLGYSGGSSLGQNQIPAWML